MTPAERARAIDQNRRHRNALGWQQHHERIARHLGFSFTPDEGPFAEAVYAWQRGRPSGAAVTVDGILGPRSWFVMALEIGLPWLNLGLVKRLNLQYRETAGWGEYYGRIVDRLPHLDYSPDLTEDAGARDFAIAVAWWQLDHPPLGMDGVLGPETWQAMRSAGVAGVGPRVKPTFSSLVANYPNAGNAVGTGGTLVNNPQYDGVTCAIRLSIALEGADPGILHNFGGGRAVHVAASGRRIAHPYATSAQQLRDYLAGSRIGWQPQRLNSLNAARSLGEQGIIFWRVKPQAEQQQLILQGQLDHVWPNHVDLWDPAMRSLPGQAGLTMRWFPPAAIVAYAEFFALARGYAESHGGSTHPMASGASRC